jgi:hypothetical protein
MLDYLQGGATGLDVLVASVLGKESAAVILGATEVLLVDLAGEFQALVSLGREHWPTARRRSVGRRRPF